MQGKRRVPAVIRIVLLFAFIGLSCWTALVAFVVYKEHAVPELSGNTDAIIVLGAQVREDGTLSLQLLWRMEEALRQYQQHPQTIVVCGAKGANEPAPEAHVMREWLIAHGVPEDVILMDDASFNTRENIANAKILLPHDAKTVLIVTSKYHLPRAMALANDMGLSAEGVGSSIKPIYWIKNYYREALAWVKYLMQKWGIMPI